jgi:hypothetical protein
MAAVPGEVVVKLWGSGSDQYSANRRTGQKEKPEKDFLPIFQLPVGFVTHA